MKFCDINNYVNKKAWDMEAGMRLRSNVKLVLICMICALVVGYNYLTVNAGELERSNGIQEDFINQIPSYLKWKKYEFYPEFNVMCPTFRANSSNENYRYTLYLFRNGEYICTIDITIYEMKNRNFYQSDISEYLNEPGVYTYKLGMFPDMDIQNRYWDYYYAINDEEICKCITDFSQEYEIIQGVGKLSKPTDIICEDAVIRWKSDENIHRYDLEIYSVNENDQLDFLTGAGGIDEGMLDLSLWKLPVDNEYEFHIISLSTDYNRFFNSDVAIYRTVLKENISSQKYTEGEASQETEKAYEDIENEKTRMIEIKKSLQNSMMYLMKTVISERQYKKKNNSNIEYSVYETAGTKAGKVNAVGAAFNLEPGKNGCLDIECEKKENPFTYRKKEYINVVSCNISMEQEGEQIDGLTHPIKLTLPIPEGNNPDSIVILHKTEDESYELIESRVSVNKKEVSFILLELGEYLISDRVDIYEKQEEIIYDAIDKA